MDTLDGWTHAWDGIGWGAYPDLIILTEEEDDIHALHALVEIEVGTTDIRDGFLFLQKIVFY